MRPCHCPAAALLRPASAVPASCLLTGAAAAAVAVGEEGSATSTSPMQPQRHASCMGADGWMDGWVGLARTCMPHTRSTSAVNTRLKIRVAYANGPSSVLRRSQRAGARLVLQRRGAACQANWGRQQLPADKGADIFSLLCWLWLPRCLCPLCPALLSRLLIQVCSTDDVRQPVWPCLPHTAGRAPRALGPSHTCNLWFAKQAGKQQVLGPHDAVDGLIRRIA